MVQKKGFSLIEMVVVLGLLAGAGLFLGQFLVLSQRGQKKVSATFDFTTKMWEVFNVLQNSSYCNNSTNLVFKEKTAAGALNSAKFSSEPSPTINTVNWIGYQVGSGAAAQNIKVLEKDDVIENTLKISQITFERQKDTTGTVVPAQASNPVATTTHYVNLVITANPTSGSGFPVTKSFKLNLITSTPAASSTNQNGVVGCVSSSPSGTSLNLGEKDCYSTNYGAPSLVGSVECNSGFYVKGLYRSGGLWDTIWLRCCKP